MKHYRVISAVAWVVVVGWTFAIIFGAYFLGSFWGGVTKFDAQCNQRGGIVVRTPTDFSCIKVEVLQHS